MQPTFNSLIHLVFCLLFSLLVSHSSQAQGKIAVSGGLSVPAGSYANTAPGDQFSGYATSGEMVSLSFNYPLNKRLGFEVIAYGQRNRLNTNAFEKQFSETVFFMDGRRYSNWTLKRKSWLTASLLAGTAAGVPAGNSERLFFDGGAFIGVAYVNAPSLIADSKSDTSYAILKGNYGDGLGASLLLRTGVNYKINKRISLGVNCSYFRTTEISFKNSRELIIATNGGLSIPGLYTINNSRYAPIMAEYRGTKKVVVNSLNIVGGARISL